jgi:hypothetical protein
MRDEQEILVEKCGGKKRSGDLGAEGGKNIKIDLKKIGCEGMEWIHLA